MIDTLHKGQRFNKSSTYSQKNEVLARVRSGASVDRVAADLEVPRHLVQRWIEEPARIRVSIDRHLAIARSLGADIGSHARVLDLGCGGGALVYGYRDRGFEAYGFDIEDYLSLRDPADHAFFHIGRPNDPLPFPEGFFDLVLTTQVLEHVQDQAPFLRDLYRVLKRGGISLNVFPARYGLIEPHMYVPLGSWFMHKWWYQLWAVLGIRNEFQRGVSAREVAIENAVMAVEALRYVPNSLYAALCTEIGFGYKWFEQEAFDHNPRQLARLIGRVNRVFPFIGWAIRNFHSRRLALSKPV